jgi:SAM-dependent methyltransferase
MNQSKTIEDENKSHSRCPQCVDSTLDDLGKLPDCYKFMGRDVDKMPGGRLYFCKKCKLRFRYPVQTQEKLNNLYDQADINEWDGGSSLERMDFSLVTTFILSKFEDGSKILDVGCYTGDLLLRFPSTATFYGVEPNTNAGARAASRRNATVWTDVEQIPKDEKFDFIILTDVIEHVGNPRELLDNLRQHLRSGGYLLITTGDADNFLWKKFGAKWWYCSYVEHISFVSVEWMKEYAIRSNLSLDRKVKFRYGKLDPTRWLLSAFMIYLYGTFGERFLRMYDKVRYYLTGRKIVSVPTGCGVIRDHIFIALRSYK